MQNSDFLWYIDNLKSLFDKYGKSFVAIKDKKVLGVYDSYADGVTETLKSEPVGTFIVQQCGSDESAYTSYIASMNFC